MVQPLRKSRVGVWFSRLGWLAGGALIVLGGMWIVPPCVTHRVELINIETAPADAELSLVTGWGERTIWKGRIDGFHVRDLAFDLGPSRGQSSEGHYRLRGSHVGIGEAWDREFSYVTTNYDIDTEIVLVGSKGVDIKRRSRLSMCPSDDLLCLTPIVASLAFGSSRCLIKGREAWWRR